MYVRFHNLHKIVQERFRMFECLRWEEEVAAGSNTAENGAFSANCAAWAYYGDFFLRIRQFIPDF